MQDSICVPSLSAAQHASLRTHNPSTHQSFGTAKTPYLSKESTFGQNMKTAFMLESNFKL